MGKLTRRQLIKLASIAGAGAFMHGQILAVTETIEKIKEIRGPGRYKRESDWVPPPKPDFKFCSLRPIL